METLKALTEYYSAYDETAACGPSTVWWSF